MSQVQRATDPRPESASTALLTQLYVSTRSALGSETNRRQAGILAIFADAFPLLPQSIFEIHAWLAKRKAQVAPSTFRGNWQVWSHFYQWVSKQYGYPNIFEDVPKPGPARTVPTRLTDEEAGRIWDFCWASENPEWIALAMLLLSVGPRIGEIASIRRSHIMPTYIIVPRGKTGGRELPIPHPEFHQVIGECGKGDYLWFAAGKPRTAKGLTNTWRMICGRVGIEGRKAGPHAARHRVAMSVLKASGDIMKVKWLLGHSNINNTLVYARLEMRDVVDGWEKISPVRTLSAGGEGTQLALFTPKPAPVVSKRRIPRETILALIRDRGALSAAEIIALLNWPEGTVRRLLWGMTRAGEVVFVGHRYALSP